MDILTILATETAEQAPQAVEQAVTPVELIWENITSLNLVQSLTFISFGVVCLFYGWRIFKILVTISFGLIGLFAGLQINKMLVGGNGIWLGIIFTMLFAFLSVPLMRWGVSILGAAAGGILTGGCWYALGLPGQYIWAGALVGIIAGGMISFIIFKAAIMLFTSLGGSTLIITAVLGIMYQYMGAPEQVEKLVFDYKWFLPVALLVPMAAGIILQNKFIKGAKDWSV